jgi:hypothetical protein
MVSPAWLPRAIAAGVPLVETAEITAFRNLSPPLNGVFGDPSP